MRNASQQALWLILWSNLATCSDAKRTGLTQGRFLAFQRSSGALVRPKHEQIPIHPSIVPPSTPCVPLGVSSTSHLDTDFCRLPGNGTALMDCSQSSSPVLSRIHSTRSPGITLPLISSRQLAQEGIAYQVPASTSSSSSLPLWHLALAGSLATLLADSLTHPVDCIKTIQQSDAGMGLSLVAAASYLWSSAGIVAFYQGFLTYGCTDAVGGAIKFTVFESWNRAIASSVGADRRNESLRDRLDTIPPVLIRAAGAAMALIASSVVTVPGEFVKQQLQVGHYSSLSEALQSVYLTSGLPGFFHGYDGVVYRDIPFTMLELGLYDAFKNMVRQTRSSTDPGPPAAWEDVVAAAATGCVAAVVTTPLDTIKTKLMVDDYGGASFFDCFASTVEQHGVWSLFAGLLARIAWIGPSTAIYLPTYDLLKRLFAAQQAREQ